MWLSPCYRSGGTRKFFRLVLRHDTLRNYYTTNFALMQHHHYSLSELEGMIPWEREVYVGLLSQYVTEENEKIKQRNSERK